MTDDIRKTPVAPSAVYSFKNVKLEISGEDGVRKCPVSSLKIMLRETALPTISFIIDPAHTPSDAVNTATIASLGGIKKWHDELDALAASRAKAKFSMEVIKNGANDPEQKIDLKDWVTISAGIRSVSARGEYGLEVTIQHPAVELDYGGINAGYLAEALKFNTDSITTSDIPATIGATLSAIGDLKSMKKVQDVCGDTSAASGEEDVEPEEIPQAIQNAIKNELAKAVTDRLVWEPYTIAPDCEYDFWPAARCVTAANRVKWVANSITDYLGSLMNVSMWEIIATSICPDWGLSIIPTYWKNYLITMPTTNWHRPMIHIAAEDTFEVVFPGRDPAPIAGVATTAAAAAMDRGYSAYLGAAFGTESMTGAISYIPEAVVSGTKRGRIHQQAAPAWINGLGPRSAADQGQYSASEDAGFETPAGQGGASERPTVQSQEDYNEVAKQIRGSLYQFCHHTFLMRYRSGVQIQIGCRLLMQYKEEDGITRSEIDDGWVIPGVTAALYGERSIESRGSYADDDDTPAIGNTLFLFYVTEVTHAISVKNATATTFINGRYVRPEAAIPGMVSPKTCNQLYS